MPDLLHLKCEVYRAHNPRWAFAPESGDGAKLLGGRFNTKGMSALYTSRTVMGAWAEANQGFGYKAQPLTMCCYEVDCTDIADLTDPAVRLALNIQPSDINCAWKISQAGSTLSASQALAKKLVAMNVSGIIVPSFAKSAPTGTENIVFWKWTKTPPHQVIVIDDDGRLPGNQSSWK